MEGVFAPDDVRFQTFTVISTIFLFASALLANWFFAGSPVMISLMLALELPRSPDLELVPEPTAAVGPEEILNACCRENREGSPRLLTGVTVISALIGWSSFPKMAAYNRLLPSLDEEPLETVPLPDELVRKSR